MTPEQLNYVRGELQRGQSPEAVANTLREGGYSDTQIAQLLEYAKQPEGTPLPPAEEEEKVPTWIIVVVIVVVGIIGIGGVLSVTVLGSLNDARETSLDAMAKQTVSNSRAMAELYFNEQDGSYAGFCDSQRAAELFSRIESEGFVVACEDAPEAYRASVELLTGSHYCVDSMSFGGEVEARPTGLSCQ